MIRLSFAAAVVIAAALGPASALAQAEGRGPFIGVGVGMGMVRDARLGEQAAGPMLHERAGWAFGRRITPMVEGGGHRMLDVRLPLREAATARVLKTSSLLASVQVGLPRDFYVRPGVGAAWNAFAVRAPGQDGTGAAKVRMESGFAAGLAFGRTLQVARIVPVAIEAVTLWSAGAESTGARWAAGIQIVPMLRF